MTAYYNEFDPKAAEWLRQLIELGEIAPGFVDERSILDVKPKDLEGYTQHHFFAGIGVWSYALRQAGWSDDRPVCTASLPCQPFSNAGTRKGTDDERHLLPHFLELVKECRFNTIFGEQVESAVRYGWLDDLQTVMEGEGYAVGHTILGAHSVDAAHIRKRIFWVADASFQGSQGRLSGWTNPEREAIDGQPGRYGSDSDSRMANPNGEQRDEGLQPVSGRKAERDWGDSVDSKHAEGGMGYSEYKQRKGGLQGYKEEPCEDRIRQAGELAGPSEVTWWHCRDERYRPIKSGIAPLVDGSARSMGQSCNISSQESLNNTQEARVMRLKGYGNAIVAQTAQVFIEAAMDSFA